jgi:hypothetical protein
MDKMVGEEGIRKYRTMETSERRGNELTVK